MARPVVSLPLPPSGACETLLEAFAAYSGTLERLAAMQKIIPQPEVQMMHQHVLTTPSAAAAILQSGPVDGVVTTIETPRSSPAAPLWSPK